MILIADGGSTKVDWIALDKNKQELFRTRTRGLNPAILSNDTIFDRVNHNFELTKYKEKVTKIYFYGAGCSTPILAKKLKNEFSKTFINAEISIKEDMLAAVYAASAGKEAIVCILGTGSNSTYFDGLVAHENVPSLGYTLMDEASGNFFGKRLLVDYFYKKMPLEIAAEFSKSYNLDPDEIKRNLYIEDSPNAYLGNFAEFMFNFKEHKYIHNIIKEGFTLFFERQILPYNKPITIPIYFIGSIAFYFENFLHEVAQENGLEVAGILQRPIDNLIKYHQKL
jgi:N-acetylglucosamine kinase-like BadF-type ATPase